MNSLRKLLSGHEEGNAIAEFGACAVLLVMVLIGVVELGRMILVYTTIADATRAGARYAIVHGADRTGSGADGPSGQGSDAQVKTVVKNFASAGMITLPDTAINVTYPQASATGLCTSSGNLAGCQVQVSVTYQFLPLLGYYNSMLSVPLSSTSEGVIAF